MRPSGGGEGGDRLLMAGGTEGRGDIGRELHRPRCMGGVAAQAVALGHGRGVGLVAILAEGALAVLQMAVMAVHGAMAVRRVRHLAGDRRVTGEAGRRQVGHLVQLPAVGRMGLMAGAAALQREVGVFHRVVAAVAARGGASGTGGMLTVAAVAADLLLVGCAMLIEACDGLLVAGGAPGLGDSCPVADRQRLVGRMAGLAVPGLYGGVMGIVAIGAGGQTTVGQMAFVAGELGMGIGEPGFTLAGIGMAGEADRPGGFQSRKIEVQRTVGLVTAGAVGQGKVVGVARIVTIAAGGDRRLLTLFGMGQVAIGAGDLRLMCPALAGQFLDLFLVALTAIAVDQHLAFVLRAARGAEKQQAPQ